MRSGIVFESAEDSSAERSADSSKSEGDSSSSAHSDTNVQVDGVDEADIVKTDGEYIYQAIDGKLKITKATPVDSIELITEINYQDFSPYQMFLDGNQLVLIGHHWKETFAPHSTKEGTRDLIMPMYDATRVIVYDMTDAANPKRLPLKEDTFQAGRLTRKSM